MSVRVIKRVPLDFDWPLHTRWSGYLIVEEFQFPPCPDCNADGQHASGTGYNPATAHIDREFYALHLPWNQRGDVHWCDKITQDEVQALVDNNRLIEFTHDLTAEGWKPKDPPYVPTAEEVNEWERNPRKSIMGMGHDGINRMVLVEARAQRFGVYGVCSTCNGEGDIATPEQRAARDAWERTDPPTGQGYQLWETVTEGSPQSPVFADPNQLAEWCGTNATWFAHHKMSAAEWLEVILGAKLNPQEELA